MIKFSSTDDLLLDEEPIRLAVDPQSLRKKASIADTLQFTKTAGQTDIHVIALGAYEGTGCFFAGAPVQTVSGMSPIDTIREGESVLTHAGRYKKVLATFATPYTGISVSLNVCTLPEPITCTANQPIHVIRSDSFETKQCCPSLSSGKDPKAILDEIIATKAEFIPAKDILPGDYVLTPHKAALETSTSLEIADAYLFGYYLAGGCLVKECRTDRPHCNEYSAILYTMAKKDGACSAIIQELVKERYNCIVAEQKSYTSDLDRRLSVQNYNFAQTCLAYFGTHATTKRIHPVIFQQSLDWRLTFLAAYFDSAGSVVQDSSEGVQRHAGTLVALTASRNLAYDLQRLLASCGLGASIYKGINKNSNSCFGGDDHIVFQVAVGPCSANNILGRCLQLAPAKCEVISKRSSSSISSDYLVMRVSSVELTEVTDTTKYNLEVEEDNSYVVDIQVHNSNRNGDFFKEAACKAHYKTFITSGKKDKHGNYDGRALNRHHKNKPEDPKYGNIKAAAYNDKMKRIELIVGLDNDKCMEEIQKIAEGKQINVSMACFKATAPVLVPGNKYKPISTVCVGDTVITKEGNAQQVACVMRRDYTGTGYSIDVAGILDPIECTADHPIWIRPACSEHGSCPARCEKLKNAHSHLGQPGASQENYSEARYVRPGDYVRFPIVDAAVENNFADKSFATLLGYYLAVGSCHMPEAYPDTCRSVDFTFSGHEESTLAKEVISALLDYGVPASQISLYDRASYEMDKCVVRCRSLSLINLLLHYGGNYDHSKALSAEVKLWPRDYQKILLEKYIEGCGVYSRMRGTLSTTSASQQLSSDIEYIALRLGYVVYVSSYTPKAKDCCKCYVSRFSREASQQLLVSKLPSARSGSRSLGMGVLRSWMAGLVAAWAHKQPASQFIEGGFLYRRVRNTRQIHINEPVYDLTVPGDHSFVVGGIGVSNCKVAYDVCTFCKHTAYDDKTRCKHIPRELGEINKQGEMCSMDNINPRWFELSIVGRPADRVGMSLKMAAAYSPKLASDYMKIYTGFVPPQEEPLLISKQASLKRPLLDKLAKLEKRLDGIAKGVATTSEDKYIAAHQSKLNQTEGLPEDVMEQLRSYAPAKLLRALADKGIIFSPEDFMNYLFGDKAKSLSSHIDKMKTRLPRIFQDMLEDAGSCGACTNDEKYKPSPIDVLPKALRDLVGGLFANHSLMEEPAHGRVMKITIIRSAPGKLKSSDDEPMSKEAGALELAEEYASYKLAAAAYLEENNRLNDELLLNMVLQNR